MRAYIKHPSGQEAYSELRHWAQQGKTHFDKIPFADQIKIATLLLEADDYCSGVNADNTEYWPKLMAGMSRALSQADAQADADFMMTMRDAITHYYANAADEMLEAIYYNGDHKDPGCKCEDGCRC